MSQEFTDVACTACGCVCDDLRVTVAGNRATHFEPYCPLAERWFARAQIVPDTAAWLHSQPCSFEKAIAQAVRVLSSARAPLIYGLAGSSTPGQRAAVALADALGATIDTAASTCHGPSILALQQVGESTCSLGEVKHRANLVIYWASNPVSGHPRHLERYAREPRGLFVPEGRDGRTLVVVDSEQSETAEQADFFLQVQPGSDFEVLWTLRALLNGVAIQENHVGGVALADLQQLVERMRNCQCGIFFFGRGLAEGRNGHAAVEALLELTRDLNRHARFHARRMRVYGDVAGADSVLCWQTGFPFSVNLARGYPRYNPGEYSAMLLLERGEVDACVLVGSEGLAHFSAAALKGLQRIPTIVIDRPGAELPFTPHVRIATATYGIHASGTAYRMDEVPIPLRPIMTSSLPTDADVLQQIIDGVSPATM